MIKPPTTRLLDSLAGREVLDRPASMGPQVVPARSALDDGLSMQRAVLDRNSVVAALTWAADVDSAKPDPGIIRVALA